MAGPDLRQLAQRTSAPSHLTPLDAKETGEYLRHRWRVAGGQKFPFEAKALLAKGGELESGLTGVQKGSQDFMMSFFDESDIDFSKLSDEVLDILEGLQGVIGGVTASGRDVLTDAAESRYSNGTKKAYTLMGDGQRLRVGIDYAEGKPSKLTITDITGGIVETAEITLGKDENGVARMTIQQALRILRTRG